MSPSKANGRYVILPGDVYGRLTALEWMPFSSVNPGNTWRFRCECGKIITLAACRLVKGETQSCGCYRRDLAKQMGFNNRKENCNATRNGVVRSYRTYCAKSRNLECALSEDDFDALFSGNCCYCGVPPSNTIKYATSSLAFTYNGIDRVDNNIGYTVENCVSCCTVCNKAKMVMSEQEFAGWVCRVYNHWASPFIVENGGIFKP